MTNETLKLQKWALIAEIVGAFAILLTLVLLVIEVRESSRQTALNTQSLQLSAYQDLISQINEMNQLRIESGFDYETLLRTGSLSDLSAREAESLRATMVMFLRHADLAWYQYEQSMLDEDRMLSAMRPLSNMMCAPLFQDFWPDFSYNFVPGFVAYLDARLAAEC